MNNLVDFLKARLDEDERISRQAATDAGSHWHEPSSGLLETEDGDQIVIGDARVSRHMECWDPARVLADVAAKRRVVEGYQYLVADPDLQQCAWTFALRAIAMPYADHADYCEEWSLWQP